MICTNSFYNTGELGHGFNSALLKRCRVFESICFCAVRVAFTACKCLRVFNVVVGSQYTLCPRGFNHVDSFRVYEALMAGARVI